MIVTIDGFSGTGKSTIAKKLAESLKFDYFDTGAIYRAITLGLIENQVSFSDIRAIENYLHQFDFRIKTNNASKNYFIGEKKVTTQIRSREVTKKVSEVSALREVRQHLLGIQRGFAKGKRAVFEGRDMGTVVFPKAHFKFFLTANSKVRSRRRYLEMIESQTVDSKVVSEKDVLRDIKRRDKFDATRKLSPVKKARDAHVIDTTKRTVDEIVSYMIEIMRGRHVKGESSLFYRASRFSLWLFFKIFYRLKVYGYHENLYPGPAIIAGNHVSFLDPEVIGTSWKRGIYYLARASLFDNQILGWLLKSYNVHPLSKGGIAGAIRSVSTLIQEGKQVVIFPEGTRSKKQDLDEVKAGIGMIALKNQCPIIPVYVHGTYDIWNRFKKTPKLCGQIVCVIGKPIFIEDYSKMERKEAQLAITEKWKKSVIELKSWYMNGAKGRIP